MIFFYFFLFCVGPSTDLRVPARLIARIWSMSLQERF